MATPSAVIVTSPLMTGVVLVVFALAVREDLLKHRIPNSLNLAGLVLGVGLAFLLDGVGGALAATGGALVGAAALLPFYLLRGMGAGDVKLMAAAGAFLGPLHALLAAAMALMAGAVLAVFIIAWRLVEPRSPLHSSPSKLLRRGGPWRLCRPSARSASRMRWPLLAASSRCCGNEGQ